MAMQFTRYKSRYGHNFVLRIEGIIEKKSYERRAYESAMIGAGHRLYLKNKWKTKLAH